MADDEFDRNRKEDWRFHLDEEGRPTCGPALAKLPGCQHCGGPMDATDRLGFERCPWCIARFGAKPGELEERYLRHQGPVHGWFSLSYGNYLVVQRSLLQEMPLEWQERFVACLEEMEKVFDYEQIPAEFWIRACDGKRFVTDPFRDYRRGPAPPRRADT